MGLEVAEERLVVTNADKKRRVLHNGVVIHSKIWYVRSTISHSTKKVNKKPGNPLQPNRKCPPPDSGDLKGGKRDKRGEIFWSIFVQFASPSAERFPECSTPQIFGIVFGIFWGWRGWGSTWATPSWPRSSCRPSRPGWKEINSSRSSWQGVDCLVWKKGVRMKEAWITTIYYLVLLIP